MFIETAIGIAVAVIVIVAVAQLVAAIASQRRYAAQTRLATREAANAMEHMMAASWDALNPQAPPEMKLSESAAERLDEARLSVVITDSEMEASVKQIEVRIDWVNRAGQRGAPLRLVAWRHSEAATPENEPAD
jgi:hypothetical protein